MLSQASEFVLHKKSADADKLINLGKLWISRTPALIVESSLDDAIMLYTG